MTEAQKKFVALEKRKEEIKQYYEDLRAATEAVLQEVGLDGFFQDPSDGIVFKIVEPEGKFVTFEKVSYVRTRRPHEKRGDLSLKEAEAAGFKVPEKA